MASPKSLIINSPYRAPAVYWRDDRRHPRRSSGRRPAGYEIFDTRNNTRRTETARAGERIRERVDAWRQADWPGVTTVTREPAGALARPRVRGSFPFYFCQLEAIETLIWWVEAPADYKQGIHVPGDGGAWERLCNKMATGAGKTTVMAMIITWQVLNALTYPKRNKDFSARRVRRRAGPDGEGAAAGALPGRPGQQLRRVRALPVRGAAPEAQPGRGAGRELAHADAAQGAGPVGGQEGRGERRGLHPPGAGQAGGLQGHRRHQRRGAPRLPHSRRGQGQQEGGGGTGPRPRGGDPLDRGARPHPQRRGASTLLRPVGDAVRAHRQDQHRAGPVRLDRLATSASTTPSRPGW